MDSNTLILKIMNYKQIFKKILKYIQKSSSKGCLFETDFEYPKELWKLDNNYSLSLLSKFHLMIANFL